ncbi:hypothetical protein BKA56DRAFT_585273 [Ilyonectria sp. MPI-CAGE-AT-0026]|nr:hypothetical protein BKA56DRAFT_585273 [Ilyonectria sp. MPI-CAGE-AT-0026]
MYVLGIGLIPAPSHPLLNAPDSDEDATRTPHARKHTAASPPSHIPARALQQGTPPQQT